MSWQGSSVVFGWIFKGLEWFWDSWIGFEESPKGGLDSELEYVGLEGLEGLVDSCGLGGLVGCSFSMQQN